MSIPTVRLSTIMSTRAGVAGEPVIVRRIGTNTTAGSRFQSVQVPQSEWTPWRNARVALP